MVGAMAMTGMRRVTTGLGLLERPPPEAIAKDAPIFANLVRRLPPESRQEVIELAHWAYGAAGGAAYELLTPDGLRRTRWAGPVYGLALWAFFETALVPLLGLRHAKRRTVTSRIFVAADHLLYGVVVGSGGPGLAEPDPAPAAVAAMDDGA